MTERAKHAWIYAALALVAVAVYAPVRTYPFVFWDDPQYVATNAQVARGITWDGAQWAFSTEAMGNRHPLTWLSHMLDVSLFGMNAGAHHVVNLAFHVANALLLFELLRRATGATWRSAFVAALFAVHPLHVESVAWISERKDVLSTFFGLLAAIAYVAWTRNRRTTTYAALLVALACSLLAKPMLVTLPFLLLLFDFWPLVRTKERTWVRLVVEKLPLFALVVASSVAAFHAQHAADAVGASDAFPLSYRAANVVHSYALYAAKTLWPAGLSAFYPWTGALPAGRVAAAAIGLVAASALAFVAAPRRPYALVGWLWFLGTLTPVIGWVQVGSQAMADRYSYVPIVGLFVIVAWGAAELVAAEPRRRLAFGVAGGAAVIALAVAARGQVETWSDTTALWKHALDVDPTNHVAQNGLGFARSEAGRYDEAIPCFEEAIRLKPDYSEAHNNLGNALSHLGKFDLAAAEFETALRLRPTAEAHNNLGVMLGLAGRTSEAMSQFEEALRLSPNYAAAHDNLGVALDRLGRRDEALAHVAESVRLAPQIAQNHRDLGILLGEKGDLAGATRELELAVRLDPNDPEARQALADLARRRR